MALAKDIKLTKPFANPGVHALLLMARTMTELFEPALAVVKQAGISPVHHNVLPPESGTSYDAGVSINWPRN